MRFALDFHCLANCTAKLQQACMTGKFKLGTMSSVPIWVGPQLKYGGQLQNMTQVEAISRWAGLKTLLACTWKPPKA